MNVKQNQLEVATNKANIKNALYWVTNTRPPGVAVLEKATQHIGDHLAGGSASGAFRMRYSVAVPQIALLIGQASCAHNLSRGRATIETTIVGVGRRRMQH